MEYTGAEEECGDLGPPGCGRDRPGKLVEKLGKSRTVGAAWKVWRGGVNPSDHRCGKQFVTTRNWNWRC